MTDKQTATKELPDQQPLDSVERKRSKLQAQWDHAKIFTAVLLLSPILLAVLTMAVVAVILLGLGVPVLMAIDPAIKRLQADTDAREQAPVPTQVADIPPPAADTKPRA